MSIVAHRYPSSTPVVIIPPLELPTPEFETPEFEIPEELRETIIEEIISYISNALSWLFILATYIGAFASSSILVKESEDFEEIKYDILLFGTLGWIVLLFINFAGLIALVTESFWLNAIVFAVFGFVVYTINDTFNKD